MDNKIIKAHLIVFPSFFIANFNDNDSQMIHKIELFSTRKDAEKWVNDYKKKYKVKSSRISALPKSKVVRARVPHDQTLELQLEIKGGLMSDFKTKVESFDVRFWCTSQNLWCRASLSQETIDYYVGY